MPHHTTRSGKHGEISKDIYPGKSNMPVTEIHSKWGSSEYRGNPNPLKELHTEPAYTRDMLNRGLVLGFIAGTDSHSSLTFNSTLEASQLYALPGLTCTISKKNNRSSIFDAIKDRACYASSGERIFLDVTVNDKYSMGEIIKMNSEELTKTKIQCATESDIEEIIIVRNGNEVLKKTINGWNSSFEWVDDQKLNESSLVSEISDKRFVYYYVKVTATSGANC